MTEPMSVLHLTGKDPSSGEIKTFDFEIVDEVARRQKADKADTV